MKPRYLLWVFALVLCSACMETMNVKNHTDRLSMALDHYGADLRWGRYRDAYAYHVNRDGKQPQINMDRLEGFSVTSFTPVEPVLNAAATEAVVPFEMKYYDELYGTLRTLKETQKWWFNAELNTWLNESDFPAMK